MHHEHLLNIISLIDRKFEFVLKSSRETFMLDLASFLRFLREDERVKSSREAVLQTLLSEHGEYESKLKDEEKKALHIKEQLCAKYSALDDSSLKPDLQKVHDFEYDYTFGKFHEILSQSYHPPLKLENDSLDDESKAGRLISILRTKIEVHNQKKKVKKISKDLLAQFYDLENAHKYLHFNWINYCRISPGVSLHNLEQVESRINPEPEPTEKWYQLSTLDKLNQGLRKVFQEGHFDWIQDASYGVVSKYSNYKPKSLNEQQLDEIFKRLKMDLTRVYEAIRQSLGAVTSNLQILNHYRARCQWYNQDHLRSLITKNGKLISQRERELTLDLARYVFDEGVVVLYRPRFGKHELDLLEADTQNPMFIEVKAYVSPRAKKELIDGIAQFHSYLCNIEAWKKVTIGFYIIFRVDGPIYELPSKITTSRFTIYPLLIDIALAQKSGRHQQKPILINEDEILKKA